MSGGGGLLVSSQNDAIGGILCIYSANIIISYVSVAVVSVFQASVEQITKCDVIGGDF